MTERARSRPGVALLTLLALGLLPAAVAAGAGASTRLEVRILEPDRGDLLAGHVVLQAEVEVTGSAVREVIFLVDGAPLATDREPPYEAVWRDVDPLRDHLLRVTAIAEDGTHEYALRSIPVLGIVEHVSVTGLAPDFVLIDVTFLDGDGRPVVDVKKEEVEVLEDGVPRGIEIFAPDDRPLAAELLLDASQSTRPRWTDLGKATRLFSETLRDGDQASVVAFNNEIVQLAKPGSSSREIELATDGFRGWGGTTRLYDALAQRSMRSLGQAETDRRALIVLTDSFDFGSTLKVADAEEYIRRAEVEVHAVFLFSQSEMLIQGPPIAVSEVRSSRNALGSISYVTGGGGYEASGLPMEEVFLRIGERLRAQYLLGYTSHSERPPGKERRIDVRFLREGNYRVSTRRSHFGRQTLGEYLAAEIERGPERTRALAVRIAARTGSPEALDAVVRALDTGSDMRAGVSREARLALVDLGTPAVAPLRAALGSPRRKLRLRAAEVLVDVLVEVGRVEGKESLDEAVLALGDGDPDAARETLRGIRQERISSASRERLDRLLRALGT